VNEELGSVCGPSPDSEPRVANGETYSSISTASDTKLNNLKQGGLVKSNINIVQSELTVRGISRKTTHKVSNYKVHRYERLALFLPIPEQDQTMMTLHNRLSMRRLVSANL
jgi:hypothetical protein